MHPAHQLFTVTTPLWLLMLLVATAGCKEEQPPVPEHQTIEYHQRLSVGAPIGAILTVCEGPVCTLTNNPVFSEIEYVSDSAARINGVILRTKAPEPPSVVESQNIFRRSRAILRSALGEGQTFLKSGDPTYWPTRDVSERVVTLTTDSNERTVLAVGAVGPDSEKIPKFAKAREATEVYDYWAKIAKLPALQTTPPTQ